LATKGLARKVNVGIRTPDSGGNAARRF
jgi:hypothetical protein